MSLTFTPHEASNVLDADGAEGIFNKAERVWATALRPEPHLKRPCAILIRWWDG